MKTYMKKLVSLVMALTLVISISCVDTSAASGYKFSYKGATIGIGSNVKTFLKKAGKGKVSKSASCAYKGYDITHKYTGLIVVTHTNTKTDSATEYVSNITITSSGYKTKEGVKIGDSVNTMKKKYGKSTDNFGVYTYTKGNSKLKFTVSKDKITRIQYVSK